MNNSANPLVTIILPCYNAEKTIIDTIKSVQAQSYKNWKLIIIDDGSTDNSIEKIKSVEDKRIKLYTDNQNKGCPARLKEGVSYTQGKFIARIDSDDLMFPDRLEKQVNFLLYNQDVDIVGGGLVSINNSLDVKGLRTPPEKVDSAYQIFRGEVLYHPAIMGRREWFIKHSYLPEYKYSDDYALWCSASKNLKIANLQEPVIFYREHEVFTYKKYRGRRTDVKSIIKRFAPDIIGTANTRKLLLRRYIKDFIYTLFYFSGLWKYTSKLSNRKLTYKQIETYSRILKSILE